MSRNKFNAYLLLDKRSEKAEGTYPIKLRVIVNRKSFHISMGYDIEENFWLDDKEQISSKCRSIKNIVRVNNFLLREKSKVLDSLQMLVDTGKLNQLSISALKDILIEKDEILKTENDFLLLAFFSSTISEMETANRFGNARIYSMVSKSISNFLEGIDIPMKELTYTWLKRYEAWYLSKNGNSLNGLSVNTRTLRALYNLAVRQKKITADNYPFKDYSIKREETRKRAINRDALMRVIQFNPIKRRHKKAKNYYLISFYLMGISFVDLAYLKVKNIIDGRMEYKRQKTGKLHSIQIAKILQEILDEYINGKKAEDFIFGIIKSDNPKKQLANIRNELKRYNESLKEICALCNIQTSITSYVARHSYATHAKRIGVPTAIISEALGHKTEMITQIYLDSFENKIVDEYHKLIIDAPST